VTIDPRYLTKKDAVAEWIRNRILNDQLAPGVQLLQDEVARQLGVSSTPVREAFGTLAAEGFVERTPHKGVVVARREYSELADVYELRALLEEHAVRALVTRKEPDLIGLEKAIREAARAIKGSSPQLVQRANSNFHLELVNASNSRVLADVMAVLVPRSHLYQGLQRSDLLRAQRDHEQILHEIRIGDPDEAARVLGKHLRSFVGIVRRVDEKPRRSR
jgi:DNA-binding GntR family transcriptional regulator